MAPGTMNRSRPIAVQDGNARIHLSGLAAGLGVQKRPAGGDAQSENSSDQQ